MRKIALLFLAFFISFQVFAAGITTIDLSAVKDRAIQAKDELLRWNATVVHYQQQIESYKKQLATSIGVRNIEALINDAKTMQNQVEALQQKGEAVKDFLSNPTGSKNADIMQLYNKYKGYDQCDRSAKKEVQDACEKEFMNKVSQIEQSDTLQKQIERDYSEIQKISLRMQNSQDNKESLDLANTLQVKSMQLNMLTTQWEMSMKAADQRDKLLQEQKRKAWNQQQLTAPVLDFK